MEPNAFLEEIMRLREAAELLMRMESGGARPSPDECLKTALAVWSNVRQEKVAAGVAEKVLSGMYGRAVPGDRPDEPVTAGKFPRPPR